MIEPETILAAEVIPAEVVVEGLVDEGPASAHRGRGDSGGSKGRVVRGCVPLDDIEEPPPLVAPAAPVVPEMMGTPMAAFVAATPLEAAAAARRRGRGRAGCSGPDGRCPNSRRCRSGTATISTSDVRTAARRPLDPASAAHIPAPRA